MVAGLRPKWDVVAGRPLLLVLRAHRIPMCTSLLGPCVPFDEFRGFRASSLRRALPNAENGDVDAHVPDDAFSGYVSSLMALVLRLWRMGHCNADLVCLPSAGRLGLC